MPVAVARANVVLADHGLTVYGEPMPPLVAGQAYRPTLASGPLTRQGHATAPFGDLLLDAQGEPAVVDSTGPAANALHWEMRDVLPTVYLLDPNGDAWRPQPDLLASDRFRVTLWPRPRKTDAQRSASATASQPRCPLAG